MAEQLLEPRQGAAVIEVVHRKSVADDVGMDVFADGRPIVGLAHHVLDGLDGDGFAGGVALEQPVGGPRKAVVLAEYPDDGLPVGHHAVLAALAEADVEHAVALVKIADAQPRHLIGPQPRIVEQVEDRILLGVMAGID